jgi:hypothetical protein
MATQDASLSCDFCGKPLKNVKKLISGESKRHDGPLYICDECIEYAVEILYNDDEFEFSTLSVAARGGVDSLGFEPVFRSGESAVVQHSCLYLGPFSELFETIYKNHVVPPLKNIGMLVTRADEIFSADVVIEDVWKEITSSSFVVADVSGRDPNVMYEIGLAHAVGRPVLMMSQSSNDIPFGLRHRRSVIYEYTPRGCHKLELDLIRTAEFLRKVSSGDY